MKMKLESEDTTDNIADASGEGKRKRSKRNGDIDTNKENQFELVEPVQSKPKTKTRKTKDASKEPEDCENNLPEEACDRKEAKKSKKRKAADLETEVSEELVEKSEYSMKENANKAKKNSKKEVKVETSTADSLTAVETDAVVAVASGERKRKKSKKELNGCNSEIEAAEKPAERENIPQIKVDAAVEKKQSRVKKEKAKTEDSQDTGELPLKKKRKKDIAEDAVSEVKHEGKSSEPGDFSNFRISPALIQQLKAKGINSLFPVQIDSFDAIYDNFDVIVQARTGSGKTLSFALPLIEKLKLKSEKVRMKAPQVLVMAPTRELAKQVADSFSDIVSGLRVACVYGGTPIGPQDRLIRAGVDILVGTPGRIQDLIRRGSLDLTQLDYVVLDEVDRMLDMGFADDVDEILKERYTEGSSEQNPQTLLFSATLPSWVHQTASKYLRPDRKHIDLVGDDRMRTSKTVQHLAIKCSYFDRASTIGAVLQVYSGCQGRAMVFCETKRDADELALSQDIKTETHVIHGDIPQEKREMVLKGFREGRYRCLIATDVAARGLDIPEVDLVVQCSPPKDIESYIHRSGRTGRAGREGTCVLFYKPNEEYGVYDVERRAGIKFKKIGPPTPTDIINASAQDASRSIIGIPSKVFSHFKPLAEALIKEGDPVDLLAAALAVVSGNSELKPRSLLTSREGFTTYIYRTNIEIRQLGYVWRALERCIENELKETVSKMRFLADKKGCAFDIPSEHEEQFDRQWKDGKTDSLAKATELPELAPQEFSSDHQNGRGNGSFSGQRNGGRGYQNGFTRNQGGNSRNYHSNGWNGNNSYRR